MLRSIRLTLWRILVLVFVFVFLSLPVLAAPEPQTAPEIDLSQVVVLFLLLGGIAYVIEAVVELTVSSWLKSIIADEEVRATVLKLVASALGVVFTVSYGLDVFALLVNAYAQVLDLTPVYPHVAAWAGTVITGLTLGRGAQWFHDIGQQRFAVDQT